MNKWKNVSELYNNYEWRVSQIFDIYYVMLKFKYDRSCLLLPCSNDEGLEYGYSAPRSGVPPSGTGNKHVVHLLTDLI